MRSTTTPSSSVLGRSPGFGMAALLALASLLSSGCLPLLLKRSENPMPAVSLNQRPDARCVAILLPGRFGSSDEFRQAGFVDAVVERDLDLEVLAAEAHIGYYRDKTIVDRLHELVSPLVEKDREVWLVGVSLGGLGALIYTRVHPDQPAGAVLLGPFLGKKALVEEIQAGGGPMKWEPVPAPETNSVAGLWRWIGANFSPEPPIPIYLGFGTNDRFLDGSRLMEDLLPADSTLTTAGGHDWSVWGELWEEMLDQGLICPTP